MATDLTRLDPKVKGPRPLVLLLCSLGDLKFWGRLPTIKDKVGRAPLSWGFYWDSTESMSS